LKVIVVDVVVLVDKVTDKFHHSLFLKMVEAVLATVPTRFQTGSPGCPSTRTGFEGQVGSRFRPAQIVQIIGPVKKWVQFNYFATC
jgi:hypothetical protein